jgi:hypothetical protein
MSSLSSFLLKRAPIYKYKTNIQICYKAPLPQSEWNLPESKRNKRMKGEEKGREEKRREEKRREEKRREEKG